MALFLSQRWKQQPTYPATVDRSSPLTSNIIHLGTPYHNLYDATGTGIVYSYNPVASAQRGGLAWVHQRYMESFSYRYDGGNLGSSYNWSSFCIMSAEYDSITTVPTYKGPAWGSAAATALGVNGTGNICVFTGYDGEFLNSSTQIPLRRINTLAATGNSVSGVKIYLNGQQIASTATTRQVSVQTYAQVTRLGYTDNAGTYNWFTYLSAGWFGRTLTSNEIWELNNNSYQLFNQPKSKVLYSLPAITSRVSPYIVSTTPAKPWKQQPQSSIGVNWNNPLSKGLIGAWTPVVPNLLGGNSAVQGTNITISHSIGGRAWRNTRADSGNYVKVERGNFTYTTAVTFEALIRPNGFNTTVSPYISGIISQWQSYSGSEVAGPILRFGTGSVGNAAVLQFVVQSPAGVYPEITYSGISAGNIYHVVGVFDNAAMRLYVNGIKVGSATSTSSSFINSANNYISLMSDYSNASTTQNRTFDGDLYLARIYNVGKSDTEVQALASNPWQLFSPQRRTLYSTTTVTPISTTKIGVFGFVKQKQQPLVGTQLNSSNPITSGAQIVSIAGNPVNLANQKTISVTGTISQPYVITTGSSGKNIGTLRAWNNDATSSLLDFGALPILTAVTFGGIFKGGGTDTSVLGSMSGLTNGGIRVITGNNATPGNMRVRIGTNSTWGETGDMSHDTSRFVHFTAVWPGNGNPLTVYFDGTVKATSGNISGTSITSTSNLTLFYYASYGYSAINHQWPLFYLFNRAFSASEVKSLYENPWQLTKSNSRKYYSVSSTTAGSILTGKFLRQQWKKQPQERVTVNTALINPSNLWVPHSGKPVDIVSNAGAFNARNGAKFQVCSNGSGVGAGLQDTGLFGVSGWETATNAVNYTGLSSWTLFGLVTPQRYVDTTNLESDIIRIDQSGAEANAQIAIAAYFKSTGTTLRPIAATTVNSGWSVNNDTSWSTVTLGSLYLIVAWWTTGLAFRSAIVKIGTKWPGFSNTGSTVGGTVTVTSGLATSMSTKIGGGAHTTFNIPFNGVIHYAGMMQYAEINNSLWQALAENPWQILKPQSKTFFSFSSRPSYRSLITQNRILQLPVGQENTGKKILVLNNGKIAERSASEGTPIIFRDGRIITLDSATQDIIT